MAEGFDDIEMKDRNFEEKEERENEEETDFGDGDDSDDNDLEDKYGLLKELENFKTTSEDRRDVKEYVTKRKEWDEKINKDIAKSPWGKTMDKKKLFEEIFSLPLKKNYCQNSESLLNLTEFKKQENGNTEIYFQDKKIGNYKNKTLDIFKRRNKTFVKEFKDTIAEARDEYYKTLDFTFYDRLEPDYKEPLLDPESIKKEVIMGSLEKLNEIEGNSRQKMLNIQEDNSIKPPSNEMKELNEVFNPVGDTPQDKINDLNRKALYWERREKQVSQPELKAWYKEAEKNYKKSS